MGLRLKSLAVATLAGSLRAPNNAAHWRGKGKVKNNSNSPFSDDREQESVSVQKVSGYESSAKSCNLALYYTDYCISLQSPLKTKSNYFNPCHITLLLWLLQTYRPTDVLQSVCLLRNIAGDWKKGKSNLPESFHQLK